MCLEIYLIYLPYKYIPNPNQAAQQRKAILLALNKGLP